MDARIIRGEKRYRLAERQGIIDMRIESGLSVPIVRGIPIPPVAEEQFPWILAWERLDQAIPHAPDDEHHADEDAPDNEIAVVPIAVEVPHVAVGFLDEVGNDIIVVEVPHGNEMIDAVVDGNIDEHHAPDAEAAPIAVEVPHVALDFLDDVGNEQQEQIPNAITIVVVDGNQDEPHAEAAPIAVEVPHGEVPKGNDQQKEIPKAIIASPLAEEGDRNTRELALAQTFTTLARTLLSKGNTAAAIINQKRALSILEGLAEPDSTEIAEFCICLSGCFESGGDFTEAVKYCQKALLICQSHQISGTEEEAREFAGLLAGCEQKMIMLQPATVVCLTQVVTENELREDKEYEEIMEDMRQEGGKFGPLTNVVIPRPKPNGEPVPGLGKVFLKYADTDSSLRARTGMNGRKFGGNEVIAVFYPEDKFDNGDYDGA